MRAAYREGWSLMWKNFSPAVDFDRGHKPQLAYLRQFIQHIANAEE